MEDHVSNKQLGLMSSGGTGQLDNLTWRTVKDRKIVALNHQVLISCGTLISSLGVHDLSSEPYILQMIRLQNFLWTLLQSTYWFTCKSVKDSNAESGGDWTLEENLLMTIGWKRETLKLFGILREGDWIKLLKHLEGLMKCNHYGPQYGFGSGAQGRSSLVKKWAPFM